MKWQEELISLLTKGGMPFAMDYNPGTMTEIKSNSPEAALCWAANVGNLEAVKLLLALGIRHKNALMNASGEGHLDCLKLLLDAGLRDKGFSLSVAAANGHLDCVRLLLNAGIRDDFALRFAVSESDNRVGCVKLLLDAGIRDDGTSLTKAMKLGISDLVKMLLDAGITMTQG